MKLILMGILGVVPPLTAKNVAKFGMLLAGTLAIIIAGAKFLGFNDYIEVRMFGIPTTLSLWTLLMVVIFWVDANLYIRKNYGQSTNTGYFWAALLVAGMVIFSVFAHEMGHGLTSFLFNNKIESAGISWWGAYVQSESGLNNLTPWQEIAISAAGPAMNLLLALAGAFAVWAMGESLQENTIQYFSFINFRLMKINLIPTVIFFDGGKMLEGVLRLWGFSQENMGWYVLGFGTLVVFITSFLTHNMSVEKFLQEL
jgi:hypothetical protein